MIFIETPDELEILTNKRIIVVPVVDGKQHFIYEMAVLIYIIDVDSHEEYVINLTHPDYTSYAGPLPNMTNAFVLGLNKKFLYHNKVVSDNSVDLNFFIYPDKHKKFDFYEYIPKPYLIYQNRFVEWKTYPLSILIKMCNDVALEMLAYVNKFDDYLLEIKKFDNLYYNSLFKTETNIFEFDNDGVYSNYNPYTLTNRPSNSSFDINLSALPKKGNIRDKIKSSTNKKLVQFDYTSFHVYLLTKMLNFELPNNIDIYLFLNDAYNFSSKTDRDEIKMDFFKYIYGKTEHNSDLSNIISDFKHTLFEYYKNNGHVISFFLKRKIFFNNHDIDQSNKLFNYYLQNAETEYNFLKIQEIIERIPSQEANLFLYTFDSFLFEFNDNNPDIIYKIKQLLEKDGIPVTTKVGSTYGNLIDIY
jgi:hypothetical protein